MSNQPKRAEFMSAGDRASLGDMARTHQNCVERTGRARPGKTAQERYRRARAQASHP